MIDKDASDHCPPTAGFPVSMAKLVSPLVAIESPHLAGELGRRGAAS